MSYGTAKCDCGMLMHGELLIENEFAVRYVCNSCGSEWWREDFVHMEQLSFDDFKERKKKEQDARARIALLRLKWKEENTLKGKIKKWAVGLKHALNAWTG